MQLTCRRCHGSFAVQGNAPTPCPACGSIEVAPLPSARSPKAATTERPMPGGFSAPVSQPAPLPPSQVGAPGALAYPAHAPAYPAPVPYQQQPQVPQPVQPWGYPTQQPQYPSYPQPVQVVIQNQINAPYAGAPYGMVPYVRRKDAGVATLLSFFLPGAGQIYNGQVGKGLAFLLVTIFVNFPLMFVGVGFLTGLITWIWAMIDAHSSAEKINRGQIVV